MPELAHSLRLIPMGGLGEVGMNCLALESGGQILVIDCGTTFPNEDCGVDVLHPRFDWLFENADRVVGVCITHAHEDHIGALPHLLARLNVPLFGPSHALRLIEKRFVEGRVVSVSPKLERLALRERRSIGCFTVESIRVTHSIADATALCVDTPGGRVVHTGDFKFDSAPSDGEMTDEERLMQWGAQGVDLLLSDSTNIDSPGFAGTERDVEQALDARIKGQQGRVIVGLFASNIQRLISLGRIAERRGRRICLLGRSLALHIDVARELGFIRWPESLLLPPDRLRTYPPGEVMVLASGTQAEPGSALMRLAEGSHWALELSAGDVVLFSSRVIPGNERAVSSLIDSLLRKGAAVVGKEDRGLHASGHAHRAEQQHMLEVISPRCFIPVHGTRHHLERHAALAREVGIPNVLVIENGQTALFSEGKLRRGIDVTCGKVAVGFDGLEVESEVVKQRRDLARAGVCTLSLDCDAKRRLLSLAALETLGISNWATRGELRAEIHALVERFRGRVLEEGVQIELQRAVSRCLEQALCSRPLVQVLVNR